MMLKKLVLIPALLVSASAFAEELCQTPCDIVCQEIKAVAEVCSENCSALCLEATETTCTKACSDVQQAFCLESLLKDEAMKNVYEALDKEQQARFGVMMKDLSCIVQEAAEKTEALMEKNKDIQQVWRALGNGNTRFVLTAAFENSPEAN